MTSQLRRAVLSIPANIAEGNARATRRDYAPFVSIATGSSAEAETILLAAVRLGFVTQSDVADLLRKLERIGRMLRSLRRSVPSETPSPIPHPASP